MSVCASCAVPCVVCGGCLVGWRGGLASDEPRGCDGESDCGERLGVGLVSVSVRLCQQVCCVSVVQVVCVVLGVWWSSEQYAVLCVFECWCCSDLGWLLV